MILVVLENPLPLWRATWVDVGFKESARITAGSSSMAQTFDWKIRGKA